MALTEKQLLIRLVARADGQPVIAGFGRTLAELTSTENRLQTELRETNAEARRQSSVFGELSISTRRWLGVLVGGASLGVLAKQTFDYNQELESTQIAIAGLLFANNKYTDSLGRVVDENTAWQASNAEALMLMGDLQRESLKTAATVPQIADAFSLVYGALAEAGIRVSNSDVLQLTTRLTQTANAMKVPMEQIRQEINSLITGQVTQDSTIAKRIGLDNASIQQMQANGTLVAEIMRRTDGYAKAAEAQSNTLRGKLVNTVEIITATLSRAFGPALDRTKGALDTVFRFFDENGNRFAAFVSRVVAAVDGAVSAVGQWITKHRELLENIAATGAIVGAAIGVYSALGAVIAALSSPIVVAIAGIVGLALVWEKARKYSEIEVGGKPIAAYVRATMQVVATTWIGGITAQLGAVKALYYGVKAVFGGLADLMLAPIHFVVGQLNTILKALPPSVAALIPNFDLVRKVAGDIETRLSNAFKPLDNAAQALDTIKDTASLLAELTRVGGEQVTAALHTKGGLGGAADLVKDVWTSAAEWLDGQLPHLSDLGKKAAGALGLTSTTTVAPHADPAKAAHAQRVKDALDKEKQDYLDFVAEFRKRAEAAGDPLAQTIAKIEADRDAALKKLEAQQAKLKGVFSDDVLKGDREAVVTFFDRRIDDERQKSLAQEIKERQATLRLQHDLAVGTQREIEDRRIALIKDSAQRELAERLAANRRWFEDESERIAASTQNETERANQIGALAEERKRRDDRDREDADRQMREATVSYAEYWKKLGETVKAQWRSIGEVIATTVLEGRRILGDALNSFLDDLTSGQTDLLKSITGLSKGLTSLWTKSLTEILMSGKNVSQQLQDLFKSIHVQNSDGTTDWTGTALQGAGVGGMVGGLFQTPNNYAGVGGSIGGAIGAIIGTYFGATGVGAAIGSAIGTAIGSMIQKGKDAINVTIRDGVATVTEKGISGTARAEIQTQVQRKVKEETKSWQAILDLFPQSVRDHLAKLYSSGKIKKPSVNVFGGVESADLTDQSALGALSDFLGNDLPKAVFSAYTGALTIALGQLGVGKVRIAELFTYWGTLQGKELHDAVLRYVTVFLDAADIRDKIGSSLDDKMAAANRLSSPRPLENLDAISAAIDAAVERMAQLTDVEDIVAAQEEVNRLSKQYYEQQLQYLARIQQVQQAITNSIGSQREQIRLAGMGDQQKVDYFFQRMLVLRGQLERTTDPEEISRLTQQIQQYVSQAMGVAPDNQEMRDKLLAILTDIEVIANNQLDKAKQEVIERDAAPASALERAAQLLSQAAQDISNAAKPAPAPTPSPAPGEPSPTPTPVSPRPQFQQGNSTEAVPVMVEIIQRLDELAAAREVEMKMHHERRAEQLFATVKAAMELSPHGQGTTAEDIAGAVREGLRGMEFRVVEPIVVDNGDLGESLIETAERRVITTLRDDPYTILPRAA
ncbi:MAG TPA: hypothetical protein VFN10_15070 [Thermoanaerobaculia bacterium]|nr:hypothetical protein [Thermoanaerobaculia bacterium]